MSRVLVTSLAAALSCASPSPVPLPGASASSASAEPVDLWPKRPPNTDIGTIGGRRHGALPEGSVIPKSVASKSIPAPFVLVLHGYGGNGASFVRHFQLARLAEKTGFIYFAPDGEPDKRGSRFWNAGPSCCNFDGVAVDHVLALGTLLQGAADDPRVDARRIYVVGYSNGGFMAHRLGCEVPLIRGILSVAGAGVTDISKCPYAPEIVLEVHGDADVAVPFDGGNVLSRKDVPPHPGALATVTAWATKKGCVAAPELLGTLDLEAGLPENETERLSFSCASSVTLLKVKGAGHSLAASELAIDTLMGQLMK